MAADPKKFGRKTEAGANTVAGTVGLTLGAAKLRDQYKEDYGDRHVSAVASHVEGAAPKARRLVRVLSEGKPHFPALVAGSTAAAVGTGISRYRKHQESKVAKADDVDPKLPKYIVHDGRRKRVLGMHDKDHFKVLDPDDMTRIVHRSKVKFIRPIAKSDQSPLPAEVQNAMNSLDGKARKLKGKLVPATPIIVERVGSVAVEAGQSAATNVKAKLQKPS